MTSAAPALSVLPYLLKRHRGVSRAMAVDTTSAQAFAAWRRKLRRRLRELTGFDTMTPAPPRPRTTETIECDGYLRQRVVIQTEPGIDMPMYVLIPADLRKGERRAVVLCPHGHGGGGKVATAGVRDHSPHVAQAIDHYNYDYGVKFARAGLIAFCPDARGFGERLEPTMQPQLEKNPLTSSCQFINQMAYPLGQTIAGMWAWDLHALARYVQTRRDCDPDRIACAGLSGGGLQTLWATALDEQNLIKAAVISGYFYGYKQSLLVLHQNCSCNYVPHLYETADMGDIAALIAPRPLLIETGDQDSLNGAGNLGNVRPQLAMTAKAYNLLKARSNLVHDIFHGPHRWHGERAIPWLTQQLHALAG